MNAVRQPKVQSYAKIQPAPVSEAVAWVAVVVAGLGYFVDCFDMWLFANFRVSSLKDLGLTGAQITEQGAFLINCQQAGFLLGGFIWGLMGDKRGRVSVMFGSIFLYSVATLLSAFVTSVPQYAVLRFITGFGLAGEIGAGITLVSELLPAKTRGYGTTLVATLGVAGAIGAAYAGMTLSWKTAYIIGGILGFALLALRFIVLESGMYSAMRQLGISNCGSLRLLFCTRSRAWRFTYCVIAGIPIYFVFGLLVAFAPEIAPALGIVQPPAVADVMLLASIGMTAGDFGSGMLSQLLKSRRKPILAACLIGLTLSTMLCTGFFKTASAYIWVVGFLGLCVGYWACLITTTAEQFGTNLRATVTTCVPNVIRATVILLNLAFVYLSRSIGPLQAALWLGFLSFGLALVGILNLRETYGKDLNYLEK